MAHLKTERYESEGWIIMSKEGKYLVRGYIFDETIWSDNIREVFSSERAAVASVNAKIRKIKKINYHGSKSGIPDYVRKSLLSSKIIKVKRRDTFEFELLKEKSMVFKINALK